jgi:uncharacterized protein (DUF433 family)
MVIANAYRYDEISGNGEVSMQDVMIQHVTKKPGICGGRACIAGHRIRVMDIVVWHERRGYSPDEIVDIFPGITLADVYAAMAYYFDHRDEIEADFRESDEWAQWVKSTIPTRIPAEFRENAGRSASARHQLSV